MGGGDVGSVMTSHPDVDMVSFTGSSRVGKMIAAVIDGLQKKVMRGLSRNTGSMVAPAIPGFPGFAPRAKRVIYLFMAGAPSHLELFDHKPELAKYDGKLPRPDFPCSLVDDSCQSQSCSGSTGSGVS